jgi:hypothetical protein
MRYPFWLLVVVACCEIVAADAQTTATPGMGPTSPLGTPSSDNSSLGANASGLGGIPLGATEINTPGVSPLAMPCPNTSSNAAFDGGGSNLSSNCSSASSGNAGSAAAQMSGAGSAGSGSTTPSTSSGVVGSGITLGSTDLATPGESQTTPVPGVTPCIPSANQSSGSSTSSGLTPSTINGGC